MKNQLSVNDLLTIIGEQQVQIRLFETQVQLLSDKLKEKEKEANVDAEQSA